jgi:hypothetical protein
MGAVAESKQKNRACWQKHNANALIQPHHSPVNVLGGHKFPNAPNVKLREETKLGSSLTPLAKPDANLDIPDFLKR